MTAQHSDSADEPPATPGVVRGSGDAALAAAIGRNAAKSSPAARNLDHVPPLPIFADTANLRLGPGLAELNLPLLPLVGVWRGEGRLHLPGSTQERPFGQQLTLSHDGRNYLRHESITWLLDDHGVAGAVAERELGWWRPQPNGEIELILAGSDGVVEVYYGQAQSLSKWSLGTDAVIRTTSATAVTGATRLYGIVDGKLAYVTERASTDHELAPHASALLERVAG